MYKVLESSQKFQQIYLLLVILLRIGHLVVQDRRHQVQGRFCRACSDWVVVSKNQVFSLSVTGQGMDTDLIMQFHLHHNFRHNLHYSNFTYNLHYHLLYQVMQHVSVEHQMATFFLRWLRALRLCCSRASQAAVNGLRP